MKILIVEDQENIRLILKLNLEMDGHTVIQAENGLKGLEKIKEMPDLVLLDIMMPEMNGLEACSHIKADEKTKDIPVFMLTAKSQIGDIENAFKAGADDYLTKPFEPAELNKKLMAKFNKYKKSLEK